LFCTLNFKNICTLSEDFVYLKRCEFFKSLVS